MSLLVKNLKLCASQEAYKSLDLYFQKVSHANRYRFHKRLVYKALSYPPNQFGETDYAITTKQEENEYIKNLLQVKKHPEEPLFPNEYTLDGPPKGRIYDKQPFKYQVEAGKVYSICSCGYSNNQPFCDGTHKMLWTTHLVKKVPKYRPIKYVATETKDVWFCNCKQSSDRPFCDGSHKLDKVKNAISVK